MEPGRRAHVRVHRGGDRRRVELDPERFDLRQTVELAVEAQRHRMDGKRQRLTIGVPAQPVPVFGDPVRIQQVVGNLLNNASKYTPGGGAIRLALAIEPDGALVEVADDGVGIPPDKLAAIFDLFVQVNPSLARTEGGLGVGLTLVKRIVELHGGRSPPRARAPAAGPGSSCACRLAREGAREALAAPAEPDARVLRVLVVEDNDDGREMLVTLLELNGHEVGQAATGADALTIARQWRPDVVQVDIGLPDMDGAELGRRLREALGPRAVVAAVTGYGQPHDRARSREAGFDAHLVKPVEPASLAEVLRLRGERP